MEERVYREYAATEMMVSRMVGSRSCAPRSRNTTQKWASRFGVPEPIVEIGRGLTFRKVGQ